MINLPPEEPLMNLECRYSLVIAVAKRARQIVARREPGAEELHKPVTIALQEIEQGKVKVVPKQETEREDTQAQDGVPEAPEGTEKPQ